MKKLLLILLLLVGGIGLPSVQSAEPPDFVTQILLNL